MGGSAPAQRPFQVVEHYARYTLRLGPDLNEEKVAQFLAICASTWCARHAGDRDAGGRAPRRPSS